MRTRFAKALWTRRGEASAQKGSLRILPLLACAVAVIAGMLLMADRARQQADRARQAQVLMERVRNGHRARRRRHLAQPGHGERGVAGDPGRRAAGLQAGRQQRARAARAGRAAPQRAARSRAAVGDAYGIGINTLAISRRNPRAGRRMALTHLQSRHEAPGAWPPPTAAHRQDERAEAALLRARIGGVASLVFGVLLLALLGWRLHRIQRRLGAGRAGARRRAPRRGAPARARAPLLRRRGGHRPRPRACAGWPSRCAACWAMSPRPLVGRRLADLVHPDDAAQRCRRFLQDAAEQEGDATMLSVRLRGADGELPPPRAGRRQPPRAIR